MRHERAGLLEHRNRNAQLADVVGGIVETARVVDKCGIASLAHVGNDVADAFGHLGGRIPASLIQMRERLPVKRADDGKSHSGLFSSRSINSRSRSYFARKRTGLTTKRAVE